MNRKKSGDIALVITMFLCYLSSARAQQPGDVAADAIKIDAAHISQMRDGTAIIEKGNKKALINPKGGFVIPFGVYSNIAVPASLFNGSSSVPWLFTNGIYYVSGTQYPLGAFINATGKIIYAPPPGKDFLDANTGVGDSGLAYIRLRASVDKNNLYVMKHIWFNSKGEQVNGLEMRGSVYMGENLLSFQVKTTKGSLYGFKNLKGQIVIPAKYYEVRPFSEGLAAVSIVDEFGKLKWGFISRSGETIIPFKFSIQPADFNGGLAFVEAVNAEDFNYAYIDKRGTIVKKISQKGSFNYRSLSKEIFEMYPSVDSLANPVPDSLLFKKFNLPSTCLLVDRIVYHQQLLFKTGYFNDKFGVLDLKTGTAIPPVFQSISFFDSKSELAYARFFVKKNQNGKDIYREGLVNRKGVFVIILESEGEF